MTHVPRKAGARAATCESRKDYLTRVERTQNRARRLSEHGHDPDEIAAILGLPRAVVLHITAKPLRTSVDLDAVRRRSFFEDTRLLSEVLPGRIRRLREARGLKQWELAEAMTNVGSPLDHDDISKIEAGKRRVTIDELVAFPYALGVPPWRLIASEDGEQPIRAGAVGLERQDVVDWFMFGPWPNSRDSMRWRRQRRLTREIGTMVQVAIDERDATVQREHGQVLQRLLEDLRDELSIRPGVMERLALRDAMADPGTGG